MENQLNIHKIKSPSPAPSVEALLHTFLPHKYVDHTHADSILILTNQKHGKDLVTEALGEKIILVDYTMSGFPLAKAVIQAYEKKKRCRSHYYYESWHLYLWARCQNRL